MHGALGKHTADVNFTTADIYHQQVLNNVARFVVNPASMPSFSVVVAGTVNIEDAIGTNIGPTYSPTLTNASQGNGGLPILSLLFALNSRRAITENWSTEPVKDSDNLRRMRCAFKYLVGIETCECDQCEKRLNAYILGGSEAFDCMFPREWYQIGDKDDVPCDACFVANCRDHYVWVTPDGMDGFTRFTITILDIATGEIRAPLRTVVKKYNGEPEAANLQSTEITVNEVDPDALKRVEPFRQDLNRPENSGINRGLFFVPR